MKRLRASAAFTIVELAIVIVVIAILATITVVAYNGYQEQSRDAVRKQDLRTIADAAKLYQIRTGSLPSDGSGCGNGNADGWYSAENTTTYLKSTDRCFREAGVLRDAMVDPSGLKSCSGLSCHAYMYYTCPQAGKTVAYVYANLETVGHTDTDTDGTCASSVDTNQGMNYFVKIETQQ